MRAREVELVRGEVARGPGPGKRDRLAAAEVGSDVGDEILRAYQLGHRRSGGLAQSLGIVVDRLRLDVAGMRQPRKARRDRPSGNMAITADRYQPGR
jgi:hypothetical protein